MKKTLILATAAIAAMASCTKETFVGDMPAGSAESPIVFGNAKSAITKAAPTSADYAEKLGDRFVVYGWKNVDGANSVVFDHYNIKFVDGTERSTESNLKGWEYVGITPVNGTGETEVASTTGWTAVAGQTIKYWDNKADYYKFIAFSKGKGFNGNYASFSTVDSTNIGTNSPVYTASGRFDELAAIFFADLDSVGGTDNYKRSKPVTPEFKPVTAKIRVAFYENVPGYSIKSLKFLDKDNYPSSNNKVLLYYLNGDSLPTDTGNLKVFIDKEGKASAQFEPAQGTTAATMLQFNDSIILNKGKDYKELEANKYMGRTSNEASYSNVNPEDAYKLVFPSSGTDLGMKVKYTLVSTDGGGEEIEVGPIDVKIYRQFTQWKSNYAYTYIFKITDSELEPITFDAVVTDTQEGVQETITTVADSALTTYAHGVNPTAKNEYAAGSNIYVSLKNPGTATLTASNTKLYTVTVAGGACQSVTEASVANCLSTATEQSGVWTVTDANGKALTVTAAATEPSIVTEIAADDAPDGNPIAGNFAKIANATAGMYAFEYKGADGVRSYKIIFVAAAE